MSIVTFDSISAKISLTINGTIPQVSRRMVVGVDHEIFISDET
jgi:hypothetical protein